MNGSEQLALASSTLPPLANRLRKKLGNNLFGLLLYYIEGDYPSHKVASMFGLRVYQVTLWRKVLTFESRKLVPELSQLKPLTPLRIYVQGIQSEGEDRCLDTDCA